MSDNEANNVNTAGDAGGGNLDWLQDKTISDILGAGNVKLPEDLVVFWGYPANSDESSRARLYTGLQFNEYIEFDKEDLAWVSDLGERDEPLSGALVWLKRTAQVRHVRVQTIDLQRSFLQGNIASGATGAGMFWGGSSMAAGGGGSLACGGGGPASLACGGGGSLACGGGGSLACGGGGSLACGGGGASLLCRC